MSLHIIYGPSKSGKTLNSEGIKKLLSCDVAFDWSEQLQIRNALRSGLTTLVFALDENPKAFREYRGLFNGAEKTSVAAVRRIMADEWRSSPKNNVRCTACNNQ